MNYPKFGGKLLEIIGREEQWLMNKITYGVITLLVFYLGQAYGATEVELVNERTVDGEKQMYTVNALYQEDKSRYTFHDQDGNGVAEGSYLLSLDGGKTAYYIDTKENTCHQWNNEELVETLSQFLLKTAGRFNIKASDLEISKLFEKPADTIHGFETKHIRIKLRYTASYRYLLFRGRYQIERLADIWVTPKMENIDSAPIFQATWQHTGNDELDRQIQSMLGPDTNYRLRSEIQQTRTDKKGKQSNLQITQYIKSVTEINDLPDDTFHVPDCRKVDSDQMEKKFKALLKDLTS